MNRLSCLQLPPHEEQVSEREQREELRTVLGQETMGLDPFSGAAFVLRAKRAEFRKLTQWARRLAECIFLGTL